MVILKSILFRLSVALVQTTKLALIKRMYTHKSSKTDRKTNEVVLVRETSIKNSRLNLNQRVLVLL